MKLIDSFARLAVALWLGALIWQMAGVQALFAADRATALLAAPILFHRFENYQLIVGLIAVILGALRFRSSRMQPGLLLCALILAVVSTSLVTPHIDALRDSGQSSTPAFKYWHAASMLLYCTEALLLSVSVLLPVRIRESRD